MRYIKKYIGVLYNLLVCVTGGSLLMMIIWLLLQIFVFASFAIPSDSMEPVLIPGDYVLVNKMLKGPRIFSLGDARQHKPLHIDRLKGFSEFQRNEVLVFNFPYPERWDSIGFNLMLYYVKRCIALPGDTVEIRDTRYRVRGYDKELGNIVSQNSLAHFLEKPRNVEKMIQENCFFAYPGDTILKWSIKDFGPFYLPSRGDTIVMDDKHYLLYRNLIEWEQQDKLIASNGHFYLNGREVEHYVFMHNYYFMGGDNCYNSQDSRYWGPLPEEYIVGSSMRVCGVYFVFVILLSACTNGVSHLDIALQQAKHNKAELEKVLKHFKHDSLKYRAACFLIENMPGKYSILPYDSLDRYKNFLKIIPQNDPISWDVRYSKIWHGFDSISKRQLAGFSKIEDIKVITGDYLIKNIEYAFKIWENGKIKDYCSFDEFCHYILPYRIDHEPLSNWREEGFQKFGHLLDSLMSPRELALRIIKLGGMRYNIGMTKYPYKQSYAEMLQTRWGTCDDMAAFLALSLRAIGIPASIDYVPAWANRSSSHCWNVVKDATGDFIEVGYGPEGKNEVVYKISKIYRKKYDIPLCDVTSEYAMPLSDLTFRVPSQKDKQLISLCTFNNHDWVPVALSKVMNGSVLFESVGRGILWGDNQIRTYLNEGKGIVFLAFISQNGRLNNKPIGFPIILLEDGTIKELCASTEKESIILYRKYPYYGSNNAIIHDSNEICVDNEYELFYWNMKWISLGRKLAVDNKLHYDDVPKGALLWLKNHTQGKEERIFTYEDGKQVWW